MSIASFNPSKYKAGITYDIVVSYNGFNLFPNIDSIEIISSVKNPWPIFRLSMAADSLPLLTEINFFGQYPLKVILPLNMEPIEFELVIMQSNISLLQNSQNKTQDPGTEPDYQPIYIEAIPLQSLYTMMFTVNEVFDEQKDQEKDPIQIVESVLNKYSFKSKISQKGKIKDKIQQLSIPPMSVHKFLQYMKDRWGLYKSPNFFYCHYDGTIQIKDFHFKLIQEESDYNLYFFAGNTEKKPRKVYREKLTEEPERNFLVRNEIQSIYHSNLNLLRGGYENVFIDMPKTDLYRELYKNAKSDDHKLTSTIENIDKIKFIKELQSRRIYKYGSDTFNDHFYSEFFDSFTKTSVLKAQIEGEVLNKVLLDPGAIVKLKADQLHYQDNYSDKYIVHNTNIQLKRSKQSNWDAKCDIVLMKSFHEDKSGD